MTMVYDAFGHPEDAQTWNESINKYFSSECEGDRLNVGPIEAGVAFGVSRHV